MVWLQVRFLDAAPTSPIEARRGAPPPVDDEQPGGGDVLHGPRPPQQGPLPHTRWAPSHQGAGAGVSPGVWTGWLDPFPRHHCPVEQRGMAKIFVIFVIRRFFYSSFVLAAAFISHWGYGKGILSESEDGGVRVAGVRPVGPAGDWGARGGGLREGAHAAAPPRPALGRRPGGPPSPLVCAVFWTVARSSSHPPYLHPPTAPLKFPNVPLLGACTLIDQTFR